MHESENVARIQELRVVAKTFFEKSLACTKLSDVRAFFDLAQQANASAADLESDLKIESCWTYLHFTQFFGYPKRYSSYLEFCARNRIPPVVEEDFMQALSYNSTSDHNATLMSTNAAQ